MAYATINKPSDYFNTVLYTGNGGTNAVTGVGFKPDWIWVKERSSTSGHRLADTTRGATKSLSSNDTGLETTNANIFSSLDSDGFTQGADNGVNENTQTYVAWNWKANAGSTSSNTDGSITSTVQANTTAGFSIVTWTGTGANATVGHGLGKTPKIVIVKNRSNSDNWTVYNNNLSDSKALFLQDTNAEIPTSSYNFWSLYWNETDPTSSVFSVGVDNSVNGSSDNIIAYCFAEIEGYSKFGKYTGNGSTDGTFVYTGFRPAWILFKQTQNAGGWTMKDNKRSPENPADERLLADDVPAESTGADIDFLSNGFKCRSASNAVNGSENYIYLAFAEAPLVGTNNIPATAR